MRVEWRGLRVSANLRPSFIDDLFAIPTVHLTITTTYVQSSFIKHCIWRCLRIFVSCMHVSTVKDKSTPVFQPSSAFSFELLVSSSSYAAFPRMLLLLIDIKWGLRVGAFLANPRMSISPRFGIGMLSRILSD